jgi:polysaccharide export outer membrane protein
VANFAAGYIGFFGLSFIFQRSTVQLYMRKRQVFKNLFPLVGLVLLLQLGSCRAYKQDIMFQLDEDSEQLSQAVEEVEDNYRIQPNDFIELALFTDDGRQLIDPNFEFPGQQNFNQNQQNMRGNFPFLVQADGTLRLPQIGRVEVEGLTLLEAEKKLQELYDSYYKGSFVRLQYTNKRVVVLGTISQVIPLENENITLLEVLSLVGGVNFGDRANNIKVIRGDLTNPTVFEVDLTRLSSMQASIVPIEPGDVIYIEPWRRTWLETLRDVSPVLGVASSVATFLFLILSVSG